MNSPTGTNEILALLDALKAALQDFAAREEKLNSESRARSAAALTAFENTTKEQEAAAVERSTTAEAAFESDKVRTKNRFEQRKARIQRAHGKLRAQVMDDIRHEEGHDKYKIQEHALGAERRRDGALADAAAVRQQFDQKLGETREGFIGLESDATKTFRGYGSFRKLLSYDRTWPVPAMPPDENAMLEELQRIQGRTRDSLGRFRKMFLPGLFRFIPIWLLVVLLGGFAAAIPVLQHFGVNTFSPRDSWISLGALLLCVVLHQLGRGQARPLAITIAEGLAKARRLHDASLVKADARYQQDQQRIHNEFDSTNRDLNQLWRQAVKGALDLRGTRPLEIDEKAKRTGEMNEHRQRAELERVERSHNETVSRLRAETEAQTRQRNDEHAAQMGRIDSDVQSRWTALEAEWKERHDPILSALRSAAATAKELFPDWQLPVWEKWTPPPDFKNAAQFAQMEVDVAKFAEAAPKESHLVLPGPATFSVPLPLTFPLSGSILFETLKTGHDEAISAINNIIFRLLSVTPPGKLSFTIFDPVGLGENFAGVMHLADYEESYINSRIWTQSNHFEEKLAELNEHMEKVIQMYLRNEYATITEYNAQAGSIAEKYHFLVIASFPVNFTDTAARRLRNIAASGARCGVYTLVHWDQRRALPADFLPDELRKNSIGLVATGKGFELSNWRRPGTQVVLDPPPSAEVATHFLHEVGRSSKDSNRVEVPFEQVAPQDGNLWSEETTNELHVPIGRSGAAKLQMLEIGKATRQHALIAGKTGSGKSTLFHVIITNLALWCSPEQVEFYLVDFKKGVEFKCYANRRLPHARVVAIESDRQFGLSVLQRVDDELRRRGDLFRKAGVQDLAGYKKSEGAEPMPRSLLIIDEFQEFFTEEDRVSQSAAVLLDRIVRQGRAFGIHVLLGSQTLGGAYTLARATIGQMVIRIALQCNEADAYLIMDQDNPAPRLLTRPGEGIYNDTAGSIEGNSPFQTVWLPEDVRDDYLEKVRQRADAANGRFPGPFVFEGNAPADVRENPPLREALRGKPVRVPVQSRAWLGAPNSIKGPTEAVFQRQSGSNLLIVGQSEERSLTLIAVSLVSLSAQYPKGGVRFVLFDSTPAGFPQREFLQRVMQAVPHEIIEVNNSNLDKVMAGLAKDLKQRSEEEAVPGPETFLLIQGLQNYKKLRAEDEFSFSGSGDNAAPAAVLMSLISDGPAHGFHCLATCDTYTNMTRFLGRKTLSEFEMRVLFQMSAADSASLIDAPDASTLGMNRAVYYNDREGYLETFRPYALPGSDWIEEVTKQLQQPVKA